MKRKRRRKCRYCGALYRPDYRNRYHQEYCDLPACQIVSRKVSQRRWLNRSKNHDYHHGSTQVDRVRAWRKAHPGYWRAKPVALQDLCSTQVVNPQSDTYELVAEVLSKARPLQDLCLAQDPLFIGFMSILTDTLQDDIAPLVARFQTHGQLILRKGPGIVN
jgi:hypothetical protein